MMRGHASSGRRRHPNPTRGLVAIALVSAVLAADRRAHAAGLEYGPQGVHAIGRGGAFTVKADDVSAFYWNPSRLALLRGTRLLYNHSFTQLCLTFERSPAPFDDGAKSYVFPPVHEEGGFFPLGISFGVSSDFGLPDWTFALGMVGPTALGASRFPAEEGWSTRYAFVESEIALVYVTAAAAWRYDDLFGFGVSLQYAWVPRLRYSLFLVTPGALDSAEPTMAHTDLDTRADLDMTDPFGITAIVGGWVRPLPFLELGFSARVVPVYVEAEGDVTMSVPQRIPARDAKSPLVTPARLTFTLPVTVQFGARYVHMDGEREVFDIEMDFVWEHWSMLDAFRLDFLDDELNLWGSGTMELQPVKLARHYRDTYSVRLGGQWNVLDERLVVRAGVYWESGALKNAYSVVDYPAFERVGLGVGLSTEWYGVELSIAYSHVFQLPRDVAEGEGRIIQQRMSSSGEVFAGAVVNEGHYESSYDVIAIGLALHFDRWFR